MSRAEQRRNRLPRLWQHEALGAGLQRVLFRCLDLAAKAVPEDVHRARLALKRARAILRLGEALGLVWAGAARARLARHARRLGIARDWAVVSGLARECAPGLRGEAQRCAQAVAGAPPIAGAVRLAAWSRWLGSERGRLVLCPWPALTRHRLRRVLAKSVRRARKQSRAAGDTPGAGALHEWRKAVIVLREQLYVLQPLVVRPQVRLAAQLHEVARKLGAAGDWQMLIDAVRGPSRRTALEGGPGRLIAHAHDARHRAIAQARGAWSPLRRALRRKLV
jgi:CHAD domain-containing protein